MSLLHTLYPVGLAAANLAVGWLLYGVLDSGLGAVLAPIGVLVLLAVGHETVRPAARRTGMLLERLSRPSTADSQTEGRR